MSNPKITIVTVVYNGEKHILPTIESVIYQNFNDYEYIIIDGNSSDSTLDIISQFQSSVTKLISEPDNGVYDAMNKGLSLAHGDFVLFLNAGDELSSPNTLREIFRNPIEVDLIYGETIILDKSRIEIGTRTELTSRKLSEHLTKRDFLNGQVVSHQSFIPRRSIAPLYNLQYKCSADIDWQLRILARCKRIKKTEKPIAKYLQGGISDRQLKTCWIERFKILTKHFNIGVVLFIHIKFIFRYLKFGAYKNSISG